jgi:hypothetical protein
MGSAVEARDEEHGRKELCLFIDFRKLALKVTRRHNGKGTEFQRRIPFRWRYQKKYALHMEHSLVVTTLHISVGN